LQEGCFLFDFSFIKEYYKEKPQKGILKYKTMSLKKYIQDTQKELAHVSWPTQKEVVKMMAAVIAVSIVVAYILGGFDLIFKELLLKLLSLKSA
jgi:preprotein translocase SecE subunit